MEDEKQKKEDALKKKLTLLGNMMKQHEWAQFGQIEAQEEEGKESKLDAKANEEDNE
jgi:hypothetical protein